MKKRDILTYWLPLILGGFIAGVLATGKPFYMVCIYGGIWGLLYGTFYWWFLVPRYEKKEEENESDES